MSPIDRNSSSDASSDDGSSGMNAAVVVVTFEREAPHEEQKFTPVGLRWPQLGQNTLYTVLHQLERVEGEIPARLLVC